MWFGSNTTILGHGFPTEESFGNFFASKEE